MLTLAMQIMPGKVNVVDFIKHEHSLLGLWFNAPGDRPDVALCCCCCASTEKLERRHRSEWLPGPFGGAACVRRADRCRAPAVWLFCYVLIGTLFISIRASLGLSSSFGAFCLTIGVLVPSTCFFRSSSESPVHGGAAYYDSFARNSVVVWVPLQSANCLRVVKSSRPSSRWFDSRRFCWLRWPSSPSLKSWRTPVLGRPKTPACWR